MVDEPFDVASTSRVSMAELALAVARGPRYGPLVDVVRVCVRWSLRRCAFSVVRVLESLCEWGIVPVLMIDGGELKLAAATFFREFFPEANPRSQPEANARVPQATPRSQPSTVSK